MTAQEASLDVGQLTERQLDGFACVRCAAEPSRMVPVGFGPQGQLFECADEHVWQVSEEFDTEARAICAARDAWWDELRAFNRSERPTGLQADEMMDHSAALDDRVEALRRRHFPRAHRLIIGGDSAITVSKTGRSTRRVWSTQRR